MDLKKISLVAFSLCLLWLRLCPPLYRGARSAEVRRRRPLRRLRRRPGVIHAQDAVGRHQRKVSGVGGALDQRGEGASANGHDEDDGISFLDVFGVGVRADVVAGGDVAGVVNDAAHVHVSK